MDDQAKETVIEKLQSYDQQYTAIAAMIGDKLRLVGVEQHQAQELLKTLKAGLKDDIKALQQSSNLTHYESAFLKPALEAASAHCSISTGSIPNAKWLDNLYRCQGEITYYLHQLKQ